MMGLTRMVMLLFACLRGNVILWQGEELGLTQVDIAFEQLQDPEAIANWPLTLSRDGTRTPMPWTSDGKNCGFSNAEPWLPLGDDHVALAVDRQQVDAGSMLSATRDLIAFRNANEAMLAGDLQVIEGGKNLLVFERRSEGQSLLCAFNMGSEAIDWQPAQSDRWRIVKSVNHAGGWPLGSYGAWVAERLA